MTVSLKVKFKKTTSITKKENSKRAKELIAREMTMRDLRKALHLAQVDVSEKLHMNQEAVSRLERRSDLLLSSLVSYIKALGGELSLIAKFPARPPVTLHGFQDI